MKYSLESMLRVYEQTRLIEMPLSDCTMLLRLRHPPARRVETSLEVDGELALGRLLVQHRTPSPRARLTLRQVDQLLLRAHAREVAPRAHMVPVVRQTARRRLDFLLPWFTIHFGHVL